MFGQPGDTAPPSYLAEQRSLEDPKYSVSENSEELLRLLGIADVADGEFILEPWPDGPLLVGAIEDADSASTTGCGGLLLLPSLTEPG